MNGSTFQDYKRALDLMQKMILATDLANHFKISKQLDDLASSKYFVVFFLIQIDQIWLDIQWFIVLHRTVKLQYSFDFLRLFDHPDWANNANLEIFV